MSEQVDIGVDLGVLPPPLPEILTVRQLVEAALAPPAQIIGGVLHLGCKMILASAWPSLTASPTIMARFFSSRIAVLRPIVFPVFFLYEVRNPHTQWRSSRRLLVGSGSPFSVCRATFRRVGYSERYERPNCD